MERDESEPKSVYIVTSGEYSSYHIDAVFLTRAEAEAWIAPVKANREAQRLDGQLVSPYDDFEIEEYGIGFDPIKVRSVWAVSFNREGNVRESRLLGWDAYPGGPYERKPPYDQTEHIYVAVEASDREHAIKIAAEQRAHFLAKKYGMT